MQVALATVAVTVSCTACGASSPATRPEQSSIAATTRASTAPPAPPRLATGAAAALLTVAVKGRAPKTGYSRQQFGTAWTDDNDSAGGHNGCDTRNDILARDLSSVVYRSGHCVVASGTLNDPYSGKQMAFLRGLGTSTAVQIDHVVALGDAWQTGAQQLSPAQRVALANDPGDLLAVDARSNAQKSDSDAASWLPPNKSYRCAYVARQVAIKIKYRLWMTAAEKAAIARVLNSCPSQALPVDGPQVSAPSTAR